VKVEAVAIEVLDCELAQSPGLLLERLNDLGSYFSMSRKTVTLRFRQMSANTV
jgi:hypothetical protein